MNLCKECWKESNIFLYKHKSFTSLKETTTFRGLEITSKQDPLHHISKDQLMFPIRAESEAKLVINKMDTFQQGLLLVIQEIMNKLYTLKVNKLHTQGRSRTTLLLVKIMFLEEVAFVDKMYTKLHKLEDIFLEQVE